MILTKSEFLRVTNHWLIKTVLIVINIYLHHIISLLIYTVKSITYTSVLLSHLTVHFLSQGVEGREF